MRPSQLSFFKNPTFASQNRNEHGGSIATGKRKLARPIDTKRPMHIVLRSSRARAGWSFLSAANARRIEQMVFSRAKRFQVRIHEYANAGNHLHLIIQAKTRSGFQNYLRTLTALIARAVTRAKKGSPKGKFWDALAYSRVVSWGKQFVAVRKYLMRNRLEALGFLGKADRAVGFESALNAGNLRRIRP